ncbi:precorrin-6y C5,15-methyltransferase (decarboxylating) subunit CbiE [Rhodococcus sp. PAMC28707]|uniref:precorrin-6y C5,15-methyltransferase (decarboxylating) subunit CbiE n=1 Tax=unclassified Rhodococcus (in: high G+C Gram-positive bacteria) TaxID=192944 RepID=UPI00109DD2E4|nr:MULTISPECIES: precorrin-6y C5,15-methyltransferase (decarboxylating) subunit CbiE [unclassified Rhodococcus (in: high G+C Gram-positive bacteria)]QCB52790.1 precorrin-6y C5,15-methyltransferase (decarboxylating) subunit CbiE [Rhodococcus sp. PAMC28705]QCB60664.1 precorrin-6y C5,15-methyltransferase (decarboxylating) subunit CbiE [Rhodococcus sp. PAMC28707]
MAKDASLMLPVGRIAVVGIGADGWEGVAESARAVILSSDVVFGSTRQLATLPIPDDRVRRWPSPLLPGLRASIDEFDGKRVCVLASGDPMFHGIGVTLAREFGAQRLHVMPAPSSMSLACARLGWAVHTTTAVSLVNSEVATLLPALAHGGRVIVLSRDRHTPAQVVSLLRESGFADSVVTVFEQLGGHAERSVTGTARTWGEAPGDSLNIVAVECVFSPTSSRISRIPGLPDAVYEGDGQLTKSEVRALTVSALAPTPGEVLFDVGGGSGSIGIEWMRTDPRCTAIAFEILEARRSQIETNARALGVPALQVRGAAPDCFGDGEYPDAVFIGGGLTQSEMIEACWSQLRPGGRLVANAVTAESEALLLHCVDRYGGSLRKFQIYRGEPLGSFTSWRPQLPVAQWISIKQ